MTCGIFNLYLWQLEIFSVCNLKGPTGLYSSIGFDIVKAIGLGSKKEPGRYQHVEDLGRLLPWLSTIYFIHVPCLVHNQLWS